ncbi:DUF4013 domain-containing protein [Halorubrum sp. Hd13]|uniref:DUF4013 domain-containing protein n=1 Tax=Halorubrum sp. Hd13 TaxID=1480728 RepID=UPI000B990F3C|nr:DUF4013 domain-containing protein [Halorubrum sp. Hd13]OYR45756.1 hypothetical protein DJ81_04330 [Halorubrum sp. Hd13]
MIRGASSVLPRSADAAGVLVVGGFLTLLAWVATPVWVGGVLAVPPLVVLAPLALAPAFVLRGYLVRVVAGGGATGNREGAPPFVAWNELYRDGAKSVLLSALLLAPLALLFAVAALAFAAVETGAVDLAPATGLAERALGPRSAPAVLGAGGGLLSVAVAAYLLAFAYVRPAALAAFAASGRLRDALRPGRVAAVAGSAEYATTWLVAVAALGAGYALAAPLVPLVAGVPLAFAVRVVAHALYGRGAADAIEFDAAEPSEPAESADSPAAGASESPAPPSASPTAASGAPPEPADPSPDRFDGGSRRSATEASAAVQTGRTVPIGADRGARTGVDSAGFEWNAEGDVESGDERAPPPDDGHGGDRAERGGTDRRDTDRGGAADGFDWSAPVDAEDKS